MPRFTPYTARGIRRIPCARCGKPSVTQWNICADKIGNRTQYRGICAECDVGLNEVAMRYMFGDTREADLWNYAVDTLVKTPEGSRMVFVPEKMMQRR